MKKIWKTQNNVSYTDEELIDAIKKGYVKGDTLIISGMLKDYIAIKDTIYQFYLKEDSNETL